MDDSNDIYSNKTKRDEIIPLKLCESSIGSNWQENGIKKYCPAFKETDFMMGDYWS